MVCPRIWTLLFSRMVGKDLDNNLPVDWMEYCKISYAVVPEGGLLRDPASASGENSVSQAVAKVVASVKKKVFGYHGLA